MPRITRAALIQASNPLTDTTDLARNMVTVIGQWVVDSLATVGDKLDFLGETVLAFGRMVRGRQRPGADFVLALQEAGAGTLPASAPTLPTRSTSPEASLESKSAR